MKIYIDSDYKCHLSNDGAMREIETDFFNGKCYEYIEGYRFIPSGETWVNESGTVFHGEMVTPWKPYAELSTIQNAVNRTQAEADEELAALIEEIYREDLEVISYV